jgi:dUTP pyrophosphatase
MQNDEVLLILPRSGHGFKYSVRLANTVGVIDADYRFSKNEGEIFVKLHNQGENQLRIKAKEAFGQGIFVKYLLIDGDDFTKGADRDGGLGSTSK